MIYFLEAMGADLVKIGFTDRDVNDRIRELQTSSPHKLRLVALAAGTQRTEQDYHQKFSHLRVTGEWFRKDMELVATMVFISMLSGWKHGMQERMLNIEFAIGKLQTEAEASNDGPIEFAFNGV